MAAKCQVTLVKKSAAGMRSGAAAHAVGALADGSNFVMYDNEDGTVTVYGKTAAGGFADIKDVATLTPAPTSSDAAVLTVDAPSGMTFQIHGVPPAGTPPPPANTVRHVEVSVTATWNDGSKGPFSFTLPVDATGNDVAGIVLDIGKPVPRP